VTGHKELETVWKPRRDKAGTIRFVWIVLSLGAFSSNFIKILMRRNDLFLSRNCIT